MRCIFTALVFLFIFSSTYAQDQDWEMVSPVPNNYRSHHAFGFGIGDYGYLVAGNTPGDNSRSFFKYDAAADEWTVLDDYPGPARGFGIGDVIDGKAYLGFGVSGNGDLLNDLWVFDPADESWTQLSDCPCEPRTHPALVAHDGFLYMGMGGGEDGNLNDWWAYDIANDSWSQKRNFPSLPRHHPYQFAVGDYVYAGFGHGPLPSGGGFISNNWYRYDPVSTLWFQMADIPAEGRVAGQQFSFNGKGYVLSGEGEDHRAMDTGEFWEYDPESDTWTQLPPHPGWARWAPASFIVNGEVYIINGVTREPGGDSYYITDVYKYNLNSLVSNKVVQANENFNIYPNPASHSLIVETKSSMAIDRIEIFDLQGKLQKIVNGVDFTGTVDISILPKGMHILRIADDSGTYQQKFMKL